jgi:hypothetical protein
MGDKIEEVQLPPLDVTPDDWHNYHEDVQHADGCKGVEVYCRERQLREALAERDQLQQWWKANVGDGTAEFSAQAVISLLEYYREQKQAVRSEALEEAARLIDQYIRIESPSLMASKIRALKPKPAQSQQPKEQP